MPPKKAKAPKAKSKESETTAPAAETVDAPEAAAKEEKEEETKPDTGENKPAPKNKKRKAEDTKKESSKASRRSIRGATKTGPSKKQLLNFLLSDAAAHICRPDDELKDIETRGKDLRTYSNTALSPFEELLCAIVLSRPISHRLGQRTIRTILNDPYNFTSPKAIRALSPEQRHQALEDARTQHKDKTASQIGLLADIVAEKFSKDKSGSGTDTSLEAVRTQGNKDWDNERDILQTAIKGLGKTGLDIFFRRVQWLWPEAYPFVDERTARGLEKLGLPKGPDEVVKLLNEHWKELDTGRLAGAKDKDKEAVKRRAFVVVCERATGADLEGKIEVLLEAAGTT